MQRLLLEMLPDKRTDDELMTLVQSGDERAFAVLVDRYIARVLNFTRGYMGNSDNTEDITQETFLRIWRNAPAWRYSVSLAPLLFTIARNLCRDEKRKKGIRQRPIEFSLLINNSSGEAPVPPDQSIIRSEIAEAIERSFARLGKDENIATLHFFLELSREDIAEHLQIEVNDVKNALARARRRLRKYLKDTFDAYVQKDAVLEDGGTKC